MKFAPTAVLGLFGLLALSACSTTIETPHVVPAASPILSEASTLGVLPFAQNGRVDARNTDRIRAMLAGIHVADRRYYKRVTIIEAETGDNEDPIDADDMAALLESGDTNAIAQAIDGVDALVHGTIDDESIESRDITRDDAAGNPVSCIEHHASFEFTPTILELSTAESVITRTFAGDTTHTVCGNDDEPPGDILLNAARQEALTEFARHVAPWSSGETVSVLTDFCGAGQAGWLARLSAVFTRSSCDHSRPSEHVIELVEAGADFARSDRLDDACPLWQQAQEQHRRGYVAPYLAGLCAETVTGDLALARELYDEADAASAGALPAIDASQARVDRALARQTRLAALQASQRPSGSPRWRAVQTFLNDLGYDAGPVDGLAGRRTRGALTRYQADIGLPATGELDEKLLRTLGQ